MAKTVFQKQPAVKNQSRSTLILIILMLIVGCVSGFLGYGFGKKALKGVNTVPLGTKMPRLNTPVQPLKTPLSLQALPKSRQATHILGDNVDT